MELEDRITVATPEGVDIDVVVAGLGSRFMSSLVDSTVQAVAILPFLVLGGVTDLGPGLAAIGGFLVFFGYPTVCDAFLDGRTVGRRLTGLQLATVDGGPVGFVPAAIRNIVRLVDLLPGAYSIGCIAVIASPRSQRLGDMAAGTIVVRPVTRRSALTVPGQDREPMPPADGPAVAGAGAGAGWDLTGVTAADVEVVRAFLARRPTLEPGARQRVGTDLARRLRPVVVGPDPALPDEAFLEALLAAKADRR